MTTITTTTKPTTKTTTTSFSALKLCAGKLYKMAVGIFCAALLLSAGVAAVLGVTHSRTLRQQTTSAQVHQTGGHGYPCADNRCVCKEFTADCNSNRLKYIPALPANVTELLFSENDLRSEMLTEDFFVNASNIRVLDLSINHLTYVQRGVFSPIPNLASLFIDRNPITYDSIAHLLSLPSLKNLDASDCGLGPLPSDVFGDIKTNIEVLSFFKNRINPLNLTELLPLKHLKWINVAQNGINTFVIDNPIGLVILDVSSNALYTFPSTCMNGSSLFPKLKRFYLDANRMQALDSHSICLPEVDYLGLSDNFLGSMDEGTFSDEHFPSLKYLYLQNNIDQFGVYDNMFSNTKLTELVLNNNNLKFGDLTSVPTDAFANCTSLTVLYLDGNNFEGVDCVRFQQLFGHLPLTYLSMRRCQMSGIFENTFAPLSGLIRLDLRSNRITNIPDGAFDLHPNLTDLYFSQNKISVVRETTFSESTRTQFAKLLLGYNPFVCSCDLLWFRAWLASNRSLFYEFEFLDPPQYNCSNIPGKMVENFTMVQQACLLSQEASIQVTVILSLTFFVFTVASLLFRYRWHLRLILYEAFRGKSNIRQQHLMAGNFTYDVFVSYASEDLPWVREHLMPELEDRLGLRLCVHERDFIPGNNIVDNIADCVQSSKKILMVFSRDFVKHQWCQFELTFCLSHAMDYDDALIIVCVDDVVSSEMTSAMMAVLKITTYIQWEEFADAIEAFWGRLRLSMNEITGQIGP
uniref:Toll-like receptor 31.2 n=1 Tax=Littorina littorea TaxID=31216 RepID=A0A7G8ZA31_LITLI|nr:toll-like receptor 31.2 [Littorina littorea]